MIARDEFHTPWRKSSLSGPDANCVEVQWRKSSFSGADSNCVEVGWRKSSFSASDSNCVEVAHAAEVVGVRDSKNAGGPKLVFAPASWSRLVDRLPE